MVSIFVVISITRCAGCFFFFQAEDGIRDYKVTGVQTCALPIFALELKKDPAELRFQNFIPPTAFPYKSVLGWEYDSGDYGRALKLAMDTIDYAEIGRASCRERV